MTRFTTNGDFRTLIFYSNFLLFLPTNKSPGLTAVLSYYTSAVTLNADSEPSINEDIYEGLGETQLFSSTPPFLSVLFGAIIKLSEPPQAKSNRASLPEPSPCTNTDGYAEEYDTEMLKQKLLGVDTTRVPELERPTTKPQERIAKDILTSVKEKKLLLTEILPDPGYFAAG